MNPPEAQSKPTAERLVEVAGEIFAAKGRQATVREICRAAGCSVAAINYYFGDKNQLYLRCVQSACERKQKLFPLPDIRSVTESTAPNMFRQFLRTICSRIAAQGQLTAQESLSWRSTLMLREILEPSDGVLDMLQAPFASDFEKLNHLLGVLCGISLQEERLRESLVTQILARCMFLRTGKNLRKMFRIDSTYTEDPEQYADGICDSILFQINGLRQASCLPSLEWSVGHHAEAEVSPI